MTNINYLYYKWLIWAFESDDFIINRERVFKKEYIWGNNTFYTYDWFPDIYYSITTIVPQELRIITDEDYCAIKKFIAWGLLMYIE